MGRLKDKLMELEEANIIEWSDEFQFYILTEDMVLETNDSEGRVKPFDLAEYLSTVAIPHPPTHMYGRK